MMKSTVATMCLGSVRCMRNSGRFGEGLRMQIWPGRAYWHPSWRQRYGRPRPECRPDLKRYPAMRREASVGTWQYLPEQEVVFRSATDCVVDQHVMGGVTSPPSAPALRSHAPRLAEAYAFQDRPA